MSAPEGVAVVRADGSVLPVEVVHVGDRDGIDMWQVCGVVLRPGDSIRARRLPPRTGITVEAQQ